MEYNHLVKKDRSNLRINLIVWERRTGKKVVGIPLETEKVELSFSADFLCKLLIEANACRVERAIEEAASKCAEESEYIAEPGDIEKVEEPVTIRRRRAR